MRKTDSRGFTLVELLVIAPIMILTIVVMMTYLFNQFGQLTKEGAGLRLTTDAQLITLNIQDDVYYASAFVSTKNPNLEDPYAPNGGWDYDTDPQTLLISVPALTKSNRDPERDFVYIDTHGCDPGEIEQNSVLQNNVILFVNGSNLYKRTLTAPPSLATCGTSFDKQTCPEDQASAICPKDILLTDKLDDFSVVYYDSSNNEIETPEQASKIKLSVRLKERSFAEDVYGSSSITIKRLN